MIQQPATPAVAQIPTPTTPSVEQPAISAVAQIPATPTAEDYQSANDAPISIQEEDQGVGSDMVSGAVFTPASMSTVAPTMMTATPSGNPDDDDHDDDDKSANSFSNGNAGNAKNIQTAGAGDPSGNPGDDDGNDDGDNNDNDSFNDSSDDDTGNHDNGDNGSHANSAAIRNLAGTSNANEFNAYFRPQIAQRVISLPMPNLSLKPSKITFEAIANWYESVYSYHQELQNIVEAKNIVAGTYVTNHDTINRIMADYLQVFGGDSLFESELEEGHISKARFRTLTLSELCEILAFPLYTDATNPVGTFIEELRKVKLDNSEAASLRTFCRSLPSILQHFLKIFNLQVPSDVMSTEINKMFKLTQAAGAQ